jgi:predicted DNA-binding protein (MmcQ/YjbR family)
MTPTASSSKRAKPAKAKPAKAKPAKAKAAKAKPTPRKAPAARGNAKTKRPNGTAAEPASKSQDLDDPTFKKVRSLCLALPDTVLTMTWGSPHFRVADKIFCGFGSDDGKPVLGVKLERSHAQSVLKEARFWPAPYVGKHGWVSMDVAQRKSWEEVAALIRESYQLIAPKASLAKLR